MDFFDVAIIGGGASGCVLACMLAKGGKKVCVVDKNQSLATKLLVTGNGRCNITNENMCSDFYNVNIDNFLKQFNQNHTKNFFAEMGIEIYADDEGRCYPISNTAKSVVFATNNSLQKNKVTSFCGEEVLDILKDKTYQIKTNTQSICAKKIVFACGYNKNITNILDKQNITYKPFIPSLVALKTKQSTKRLDGVRLSNVLVNAVCGDKTKTQTGEVLFKKDGISGICIFNLSTMFARKNNFNGRVIVDIFPNIKQDKLQSILQSAKKTYQTVLELLLTNLHKEVAIEVLKQSGLSQDMQTKDLTSQNIVTIANTIKNLTFDVVGCYDNNQVFSGGVDLNDLTGGLQLKSNKDFYFCGEICNVDGECGGYNLQWAFTSAYVVAQDILVK